MVHRWKQIVDQAKPEIYVRPRVHQQRSLEEYHKVFVLANILRRPIIVYGPSKARSFKPGETEVIISMQGIYLPLLWAPHLCHKAPLCLGFCEGYFTALVPVAFRDYNQFVVPLEDYDGNSLSVHFLLQAEMYNPSSLLRNYLNLATVFCSSLGIHVNAAHLPPRHLMNKSLSVSTLRNACTSFVNNMAIQHVELDFALMRCAPTLLRYIMKIFVCFVSVSTDINCFS